MKYSSDPEVVELWSKLCDHVNETQRKIEERTGQPFPVGEAMLVEVLANAHEEGMTQQQTVDYVKTVVEELWGKLDEQEELPN